jgi:hypothetical protein
MKKRCCDKETSRWPIFFFQPQILVAGEMCQFPVSNENTDYNGETFIPSDGDN